MFHKWPFLPLSACLVLAGSLPAQRSFPRPYTQLHDVKFEIPKSAQRGITGMVVVGGHIVPLASSATRIHSLTFSQDGKLLAAGKDYGRVVMWDVAAQKVICAIDTGFVSVGQIAISPDNQFIAVAAVSGLSIKLWHIPDGQFATTIDNPRANVPRVTFMTVKLTYTRDRNLLIVSSGVPESTDLFDTSSGKIVRSFPGERNPILSTDGSTLITLSGPEIILRNTTDWSIQQRFHKLTEPEQPVFWDVKQGAFLFKDFSDDHLFVAARTIDGQMLPDTKLADLPKSWLNLSDFAAIDPGTGLVFGHSAGELWALDLKTGETCESDQLLSDAGALSPDGSVLAGATEQLMPSDDQKQIGIGLWKTASLAKACHMK